MEPIAITPDRFLRTLQPADWIIVPHTRIAHALEQSWIRIQPDGPVDLPRFMDWSTWLHHLWHHACYMHEMPRRLHPLAAQGLWQPSPTPGTIGIGWSSDLATIWKYFHDSRIPWQTMAHEPDDGARFFYTCAEQYQARLHAQQTIDPAGVPAALIPLLPHVLPMAVPGGRLYAVNWDHPTPLQTHFWHTTALSLSPRSRYQAVHLQQPQPASLQHWICPDREREWERLFETLHPDGPEPGTTAWIIPTLHTEYGAIQHRLDTVCRRYGWPRTWFHIGAGTPLFHEPVVHIGWTLLVWTLSATPPPRADWCAVLSSPFIGGAEAEREQRAVWQWRITHGHPLPDWEALPTVFADIPLFVHHCQTARQWVTQTPMPLFNPGPWCEQLWTCWGWPAIPLDHRTAQAVQQAIACWDFAHDAGPVSDSADWLSWYRHALDQPCFQPCAPAEAAIHVVGIDGSIGWCWDQIHGVGWDHDTWPNRPAPLPFIPVSLQKAWGWPRASAEQELVFAQQIYTQWIQRSKRVAFSYPAFHAGESTLPSLLIGPPEQWRPYTPKAPGSPCTHPTWQLETRADCQGLPLPPAAKQPFKRAVAFLKMQAHCPFRAYVYFRLQLDPPPASAVGIAPATKGLWRHAVLQALTGYYQQQSDLACIDESTWDQWITASIAAVQATLQSDPPADPLAYAVEWQLIREAMRQWYHFEKQRAPFVIHSREQPVTCHYAGYQLVLRIDRIDHVDGERIIFDYKSRSPSLAHWLHDVLLEPQLPLYALGDPPVGGIAYMEIDAPSFRGLSRVSLGPGTQPVSDFAGLLARWSRQLDQLFAAIQQGWAAVEPVDPSTCRHCALPTICRIRSQPVLLQTWRAREDSNL